MHGISRHLHHPLWRSTLNDRCERQDFFERAHAFSLELLNAEIRRGPFSEAAQAVRMMIAETAEKWTRQEADPAASCGNDDRILSTMQTARPFPHGSPFFSWPGILNRGWICISVTGHECSVPDVHSAFAEVVNAMAESRSFPDSLARDFPGPRIREK